MNRQNGAWRRRLAALLLTLAMLLSTTAWAGFADVGEDSAAQEAIEWAMQAGVALGTGDGRFEPDAPCTGAALVTFLWRMNGAPDLVPDETWWSDAAVWAALEGLLDGGAGMEEPLDGATFAAVLEKLGASADAGAAVVTRGAAISALYALATAEPTLSDGDPWVDYCLRENAVKAAGPGSEKDDFYLYTNYDWMKRSKIKPGAVGESEFTEVEDEIRSMGMAVLTDKTMTGRDAEMVRHLYDAFLDWDARDALGVAPIRESVDRIGAVRSLDELTELLCGEDPNMEQFSRCGAGTGLNDSETYLLYVFPMGLLLYDSAEYTERTELGDRYEAAYRAAARRMMPRLGYTEAEADGMLDRALALEAELAGGIMTSAERLSPDYFRRTNNEMDRAEAEKLCTAYPLLRIIDAQGYAGAQRYLVTQPAFLKKLDEVYRPERLDDLKNYLIVCAALDRLSSLDRECYEIYTEMQNAMSGASGAQPDEEAAFDAVRGLLTTPMDRAFLQKYDSSKMKADVARLCEESIAYYRTMLQGEDWLSAETREKAIEKLDALAVKSVYPDKWRDYSGLSLDGLGYYDCENEIERFEAAYDASLPGTKVDHALWDIDVLMTNACYDPMENSIIILRGILGGAFYDEGMSDEELYAGIGCVIGHEISHAFDTSGAQYDASGNLNNWWTEEDYAAFTARADRLAAYYDRMTAFGGTRVKGQNVQSEAIADMAGVKCMLGLLEQKGDVDYKAFFDAYARMWRTLNTQEYEYYRLVQNEHPLPCLRVNATLQQFEQFHQTYDIGPGDGMYLAPADRVLVW